MATEYHGDIEIELVVDKLSDNFLMSPNDLHRGRGDWAGLTLRARALLAALLTMRSGWRVSRKTIEDMAPELGRKGVSTVLRELRDRGFIEAGKINGEGGRFTWRWRIRLRPDVSAGGTMGPSGDDGDSTMGPSGDDGRDQGKHAISAGGTMGPSATDGQGTLLRRPSSLEDQEDLPPTPRDDRPAAPEAEAETGGGEDSPGKPDPNRELLNTAYAAACRHQPGWAPGDIAATMIDALNDGRSPAAVADAIVAIARGDHGLTASPRRLLANGPWWATTPPPPASKPPAGTQCPRHLTRTTGPCGQCDDERAEAAILRAAPPPDGDPKDPREACRTRIAASRTKHAARAARLAATVR